MPTSSIDDSVVAFAHAKHIGASEGRKTLEDYAEVRPVRLADNTLIYVGMVADGMGGIEGGEIASRTAVEAAFDYLPNVLRENIEQGLKTALHASQAQVLAKRQELGYSRMGTTATIAAITPEYRLYLAHVGDSRAYLVRGSSITQITLDHGWGDEQVRAGRLTPEEAAQHERREALNRYIGQPRELDVDTGIWLREGEETLAEAENNQGYPLKPGDTIVICSDGLIKQRPRSEEHFVEPYEIVQIINNQSPNNSVKQLIKRALERQVDDNVSVVVLHLPEPDASLEDTKPPPGRALKTLVDAPPPSSADETLVSGSSTTPLKKETIAQQANEAPTVQVSRPRATDPPGKKSGRGRRTLGIVLFGVAFIAAIAIVIALLYPEPGTTVSVTSVQGTVTATVEGEQQPVENGSTLRFTDWAGISVSSGGQVVLQLPDDNVDLYVGGEHATELTLSAANVRGQQTITPILAQGALLVLQAAPNKTGEFEIEYFGGPVVSTRQGAVGLRFVEKALTVDCLHDTDGVCTLLYPQTEQLSQCTRLNIAQGQIVNRNDQLVNSGWSQLAPSLGVAALCDGG